MKYRKFNKYERKEIRHAHLLSVTAGSGLYLYQNKSPHADLKLPRPTHSGLRQVGPKGQFQGDDYYMQMVRNGELILVEVIQTPEQQKEIEMAEQQRLILDQPDRVTNEGTVEQVVEPKKIPKKKLNEDSSKPEDVLLNEGPDEGFVIAN